MIRRIKNIFLWWDTGAAILGATVFYFSVDGKVTANFAKDVVSVGISVLSIVFSLFFASLTFIISSSNDEFVEFLVENQHYQNIIWAFKWTLGALFLSLAYSLVFYVHVSYIPKESSPLHVLWLMEGFIFLFTYSLVASGFSTNDAIKYAKRRARFISMSGDEE
jgi:hypothetical protein